MPVYYTNVTRQGKDILCRITDENGGRRNVKHTFKPELYLAGNTDKPAAYGLHNEPLMPKTFDNMYEADKWFDSNRDVPGLKIYGQNNWPYQFIAHSFRDKIKHNSKHIRCANIDIEVLSGYRAEDGTLTNGPFPEPVIEDDTFKSIADAKDYHKRAQDFYKWFLAEFPKTRIDPLIDLNAVFPIPLIQAQNKTTNEYVIFAMPEQAKRGKFNYADYVNDEHIGELDLTYHEYESEQELLAAFIGWWSEIGFDAWTGWNIEGFDAPYLVERVRKILGPDWVDALSPWRKVKKRGVKTEWGKKTTFDFVGCEMLDYMQLYDKHTYVTREKMSLDHIAFCELGERKLDYKEAKSLNMLFFMDWEKYVRYGIKDVKLVSRLEDKLRLLELTYTLAYLTKSNYRDTLGTVAPWNAMTYNFLLSKGMRPRIRRVVDEVPGFPGGYVKEVIPGYYEWVMSCDLNSLYPHIIMQGNMGPETIIDGDKRRAIITDLCAEIEVMIPKYRAQPAKMKALQNILHMVSIDGNTGLVDIVDDCVTMGKVQFETLKKYNCVMAPNIQFYDRSRMSVFSDIMRGIYAGRKGEKKLMLEAEQRKVWIKEEIKRRKKLA